jgi:hypothetical protein
MGTHGISQKEIGGISYAFHTMPASKGMEVWSAIEPAVANAGNSLSAVAAVGGKEVAALALGGVKAMSGPEKESLMATVALLTAVSALPEADWAKPDGAPMMGRGRLVKTMFEYVRIGGKPVDVDVNFTGRLKSMYAVLGEALRVNFGDFFSGLAEVTDSLLSAAKPE